MNPNTRHNARNGGIVLALGLLVGSSGQAAPHLGAQPRLVDLLRVDPLGYECIAESDLEAAFRASAKSFHLPRTCLPDPCARRLTRPELARIIGRPVTDALWEDYLARHARTCEDPVAFPGPAPNATRRGGTAFWAQLIASGADDAPRTFRPLHGGFAVGGSAPRHAGRLWSGWPGKGAERRVTDDLGPGLPPARPALAPPNPVPLPPVLPLFLAGLLALGWRRARR